MPAKRPQAKAVNLGLQGGGAHGAFTWGVLDALLEDGRIDIDAVSGASAGAMNAVVLGEALAKAPPGPFSEDMRDNARAALRRFWMGVARHGRLSPFDTTPLAQVLGVWGFDVSFSAVWMDSLLRMSSPYDFNPLNLNPLRDLLQDLVDFEAVRTCKRVKIFVAATNVETGRTQIFRRPELTPDHVMASACLPYLFQAVEINGQAYWDGGYVGNPPLFPFFYEADARDVVVVQINPIERRGVPRTAREIMDRMREITFNASLLREYRNIHFVTRMLEEERLDPERYKRILVHRIDGGAAMHDLDANTRLSVNEAFFEDLFQRGRRSGADWLAANFEALGQTATLDLAAVLHNPDAGI